MNELTKMLNNLENLEKYFKVVIDNQQMLVDWFGRINIMLIVVIVVLVYIVLTQRKMMNKINNIQNDIDLLYEESEG